MPIFEFQCTQCGHQFEDLVVSKKASTTCPQCNSTDIKKLPSSFGFKSTGEPLKSSGSGGCSTCTAKNCSTCS